MQSVGAHIQEVITHTHTHTHTTLWGLTYKWYSHTHSLKNLEAGEMAQCLKALAALPEGLSTVPAGPKYCSQREHKLY